MDDDHDYVTRWAVFDEMVDKQDVRQYAQFSKEFIDDYGLQDDAVLLAKVQQLNALRKQLLILRIACAVLVVLTVAILVVAFFKPDQT